MQPDGLDSKLDLFTLFVRRIPSGTTNQELEEFFSNYGPLRSCFVVDKKNLPVEAKLQLGLLTLQVRKMLFKQNKSLAISNSKIKSSRSNMLLRNILPNSFLSIPRMISFLSLNLAILNKINLLPLRIYCYTNYLVILQRLICSSFYLST